MVKNTSHSQSNITGNRHNKRIVTTLVSALRNKLGLQPLAGIASPYPVAESIATTYLEDTLLNPDCWIYIVTQESIDASKLTLSDHQITG